MRETLTIADKIREARKAAGLSQRALADLAGVGVSTITDIEQGITKDPRFSTVEEILAAVRGYEPDSPPIPRAAQREGIEGPTSGA